MPHTCSQQGGFKPYIFAIVCFMLVFAGPLHAKSQEEALFSKEILNAMTCQASVVEQGGEVLVTVLMRSILKSPLTVKAIELHFMDVSNPKKPVLVANLPDVPFVGVISAAKPLRQKITLAESSKIATKEMVTQGYAVQCVPVALEWNTQHTIADGRQVWISGALTVLPPTPEALAKLAAAKAAKPVTKVAKPVAKATKPVANAMKPVANATKPVVSAKAAKSLVLTNAPLKGTTSLGAPVKVTQPPVAKALDTSKTIPAPALANQAASPSNTVASIGGIATPRLGKGKKPGVAVLVSVASPHDYVGLKKFSPDTMPDTHLQVAFGESKAKIVAVQLDSLGKGPRGNWRNMTSKGVMPLLIYHKGVALNTKSALIAFKASPAGVLDLYFQDNGVIAAGKNRLRVACTFSDGTLTYAIFDPAAQ